MENELLNSGGNAKLSHFAKSHTQLDVYQSAFEMAMRIHELSKSFPKEERYSLTDQSRRSSRSVCANLAEAWRKRKYEAAFVAKLNDAEAEASKTQTWISFSVECHYLDRETGRALYRQYESIISMLVAMQRRSSEWIF